MGCSHATKDWYMRTISQQKTSDEMTGDEREGADWQDGFDLAIRAARVQADEIERLRKTLTEIGVRGHIVTGGDCGVLRDHARKALGMETLDT